jgi:signal transduction histidine kinase
MKFVHHTFLLCRFPCLLVLTWLLLPLTSAGQTAEPEAPLTGVGGIHKENTESTLRQLIDSAGTYWHKGEVDVALETANRAFAIARDQNYWDLAAESKRVIAEIYYEQGDTDASFVFYQEAKKFATKASDQQLIAELMIDLAWVYMDNNRLDSVYLLGIEAIRICENNQLELTAIKGYSLLGGLYYSIGRYEIANHYFEEGIKIQPDVGENTTDVHVVLANLYDSYAGSLGESNRLEEAKKMYHYADSIAKSINYMEQQMISLYGMGYINLYDKNYREGIGMCRDALQYFKATDNIYYAEGCTECIARGYYYMNEFDSALYYLLEVESSIQNSNHFYYKMDVYELLSETYEHLGNNKQSLYYFKLFKHQSDSVMMLEKASNISVIESEFKYEQIKNEKESLLEARKKDEAIISAQKKTNLITLIALSTTILLAGMLTYLFYINKMRNHSLEKEVNKRTAELSHTNTSLLQANAELEEFAHISSHDLREPIRNITSFSSLIIKKGKQLTDQELEEYISIIQFNAKQMQHLISSVYEFTRINKEDIDLTKFNPEDLINDILKILHIPISEKKADIVLQLELPQIISNRGMLFIVLRNLVENSLKYNNSEKPKIIIRLEDADKMLLWTIKDNGIGIDPRYQQRIFELFKRLHNRESYEGSGLGLSISKKIIHKLQGEIGVISAENEGAEFWFTLPKIDG